MSGLKPEQAQDAQLPGEATRSDVDPLLTRLQLAGEAVVDEHRVGGGGQPPPGLAVGALPYPGPESEVGEQLEPRTGGERHQGLPTAPSEQASQRPPPPVGLEPRTHLGPAEQRRIGDDARDRVATVLAATTPKLGGGLAGLGYDRLAHLDSPSLNPVLDKLRGALGERIALMAPSRRLRLALADRELRSIAGGRPIRVLDAGCGDGLQTLTLAKRHPDWSLTGMDIDEALVAGARERAGNRGLGNVVFLQADLTLPLPESGFDAVIALECLTEIPDDRSALREMTAAVAPGGRFAVQAPDRDWRPVLPGSAATWRHEVRHGYAPAELQDLLAQAGLEAVELRPTFHSLVAAAQEIRDRIKRSWLPVRLLAFPFLAAAVWLEGRGLTWGRPSATFAVGRRPAH